ncbi:MAG: DUF1576 domain-containing protein [Chitinispirillales bacterium]|jgi:hypothetical protein|nr:DUF1576 domain-containing protein [Chitinispirillales bacterium]
MKKILGYKVPTDYLIILCISLLFAAVAFVLDTPERIVRGLITINTSRSVLITDYIALAGIGAALVNSSILTFFNLFLLVITRRVPTGRIMALLFLTIGFSLFGKNALNTLPIMAGVWLHWRLTKKDGTDMMIAAMVGSTVAPIVSEIAFLDENTSLLKILAACGAGIFIGFIFPTITQNVKRMHNNYCLYNGGIAGGFIATMFAGFFRSIGITVVSENFWDTNHTPHLVTLACVIATGLIIYGMVANRSVNKFRHKRFKELISEKDPDDNDYLVKYRHVCYINIGIMCLVSTGVMLLMGIPVNGPVLGGILTVAGFAAVGKHIKNTAPILIGSIAATQFNYMETTDPVNILAILFSTGLAPVAGKYGWGWGIVTGFLHVLIAVFIGDINGGLNLYNNGFAAIFVVVIITPVIGFFNGLIGRMRMKIKAKKEKLKSKN